METIADFDKWLAEYKPAPVKYVAVYDQLTGAVISVGPDYAFPDEEWVVDIDSEQLYLSLQQKYRYTIAK